MRSKQPDVIVVGAGIIGASIAWRLAQHRVSVQLRDAGRMGCQASSAGAGMLAPGGEVLGPSAFGKLLVESLRLYPDFVQELSVATGIQIDYRKSGAIETAGSEKEWITMQSRAQVQASMGVRSEPGGATTLFYPDDAIVDPIDVLSALRIACLAEHVEILEGSPVDRLDTLEASIIVLSAGAWTSSIAGAPEGIPKSFPVKGHLIGFSLLPGSVGPIRRCDHTYLLQRANGFTIAGSSTEHKGFDLAVDPTLVDQLRQRAEALYPPLKGLTPIRSWTGLRPGIDAAEPSIGRLGATRYWLAYGHYRNGILAAPATAARIAADIISNLETVSRGLPNNP